MSMVRKLGVIAAVVLVLSLSACTSSTAPALTRAANAAKAAAAAAVKAETAAKAAAEAAEKAEAVAEAAAARRATTSTTVAAVPTLGLRAGIFAQGKGFGEVKPSEVFNGGDPTGLVTHVVWKSWGGREAVGTGESEYVAPNQDVAEGTEQPSTIVAFKLGTCLGDFMYQAVEWYFPQHGQRFDPDQYENICTGSYVTSATTALTCPPSRVQVGDGHQLGGATGERAMTFALVNSGPGTCMLDGYPQVRFVTAAGTTLDFSQVTQSQYIKKIAPRRVLLGVGAVAYVEIAKYRCDLGDLKTASQVQLTLPRAEEDTTLTVPGGLAYCKGGVGDPGNVIAVTPVESSLGAANY